MHSGQHRCEDIIQHGLQVVTIQGDNLFYQTSDIVSGVGWYGVGQKASDNLNVNLEAILAIRVLPSQQIVLQKSEHQVFPKRFFVRGEATYPSSPRKCSQGSCSDFENCFVCAVQHQVDQDGEKVVSEEMMNRPCRT